MDSGDVTVEKGDRTNWHSHPSGQILSGVKGKGFYQEKGKPKQILIEGETVKSKPGVVHWHGATATNIFSHIAISSVQILGSSTVYPFATILAEKFGQAGTITPVIESTGTGCGIKLFCAGIGVNHPDIPNENTAIQSCEKGVI